MKLWDLAVCVECDEVFERRRPDGTARERCPSCTCEQVLGLRPAGLPPVARPDGRGGEARL